jgi:hypothetical protein
MKIRPGMYLIDKQFRDTIYFVHDMDIDSDEPEHLCKVVVMWGKDDGIGGSFWESEIRKHFDEYIPSELARILYGLL